jgi:Mor family transcriptional regulator
MYLKIDEKFEKVVKEAESYGILNYYAVRNIRIRNDYINLRKNFVTYDDAVYDLAHKYHISPSQIRAIIKGIRKNEIERTKIRSKKTISQGNGSH